MLAEKPIFLHYTKAELDRNFDQRGWIANAEAIIARHIERSRGTREKLTFVPDLRYGKHPDEMLDYFPAERKGAPIQVFVHGGAWKNFGKNDYSFPAEGFVPAGVHYGDLELLQAAACASSRPGRPGAPRGCVGLQEC